jgi:hypothetical protein
MTHKKHLTEGSKGLTQDLNKLLIEKGISTTEMPFTIKKIQFELNEYSSSDNINFNLAENKKCVKWDSKLVERTDKKTKKKYWQLIEWCVQYEGEE